MELSYKNSFFRDLSEYKSKSLKSALRNLIVIATSAKNLTSIPGLKRLKRTSAFEYKIELKVQSKIYWVLCDVTKDGIIFIRIKSEAWCKKQLKK
jgi:hypothetical protein